MTVPGRRETRSGGDPYPDEVVTAGPLTPARAENPAPPPRGAIGPST